MLAPKPPQSFQGRFLFSELSNVLYPLKARRSHTPLNPSSNPSRMPYHRNQNMQSLPNHGYTSPTYSRKLKIPASGLQSTASLRSCLHSPITEIGKKKREGKTKKRIQIEEISSKISKWRLIDLHDSNNTTHPKV